MNLYVERLDHHIERRMRKVVPALVTMFFLLTGCSTATQSTQPESTASDQGDLYASITHEKKDANIKFHVDFIGKSLPNSHAKLTAEVEEEGSGKAEAVELQKVNDSKYTAQRELSSGVWQFTVHVEDGKKISTFSEHVKID